MNRNDRENSRQRSYEERRKRKIREQRRKLQRWNRMIRRIRKMNVILGMIILLIVGGIICQRLVFSQIKATGSAVSTDTQGLSVDDYERHPVWKEDFLTVNEYSRPGLSLGQVKNIFVHYTANPGTTAQQNRNYFNNLADTKERYASAHFIIGYEGEIIQCVPLDEIAYAVQERNQDSVSIECCHLTEDGSFTEETYRSLLELLGWLLDIYNLDREDILRHYDSNGKLCPLYYVEHAEEWEKLKCEV